MESFIQSALFGGQANLTLALAVFAVGLATSLTPCVYPMLPITVSIVGSRARNRRHAFILSLSYVTGLALTYASLGVLAASSGQLFGTVASHPASLTLVAAACLMMAAWMLGWLQLPVVQLPQILQNNTAPPKALSNNHKASYGTALLTTMITGSVSGLVMAPCTSPVFGMLLMYVAGQGQPLLAAVLMFLFAFGMGALLIVAGTFSGLLTHLPRAGKWMRLSQMFLATLMLLAALWFGWQAIQAIAL